MHLLQRYILPLNVRRLHSNICRCKQNKRITEANGSGSGGMRLGLASTRNWTSFKHFHIWSNASFSATVFPLQVQILQIQLQSNKLNYCTIIVPLHLRITLLIVLNDPCYTLYLVLLKWKEETLWLFKYLRDDKPQIGTRATDLF